MKKKLLFLYFSLLFISGFSQISNLQKGQIDVLQYNFKLNVNNINDSISGLAHIKIKQLQDSQKISLDFASIKPNGKGMKLDSLFINGKPWKHFKHKNDQLNIFFDGHKGQTTHLDIYYKGIPEDGLIIAKNKYGEKSFFGDNWPNRAHFWLPVIDHPSDKALVSFEIIAPEEMDVIASGKLISRIRQGKKIRWKYQTKVPLATKVMVFGATSFNIKNYNIFHNIPISGWIYKDSPIKGLDDYAVSVDILKYYDSLIGPYSYSKLANVQSKTRFGGMENAGNIFYYENSVNGKAQVENLIAHEVAHQWFGNSVTEKNWEDIWLSEGFATYLTDLFIEHKYGKEKLKERMKMERKKVIRYNTHIQNPIVYKEENLMKLLNPNSYEKGAWVLHMLRNKIGDQKFFELLTKYYKKYKNKNASTGDFIELAEKVSKQNLKNFFNEWLYKPGIPIFKIDKQIQNKTLILHISQQASLFKFNLPIYIHTKKENKKMLLPINKKENTFYIPLKSTKNLELLIDPEIQLLYKQINN